MLLVPSLTSASAKTKLAWTSSNKNVAFVDSNGIVAAVGKGATTVQKAVRYLRTATSSASGRTGRAGGASSRKAEVACSLK